MGLSRGEPRFFKNYSTYLILTLLFDVWEIHFSQDMYKTVYKLLREIVPEVIC